MIERYTVVLGSLTTSASAVPRARHDDLGEAIRLVGAEQETRTILLGEENGLATGNVVEPPAPGEVNSPTVKDTGRRWFGRDDGRERTVFFTMPGPNHHES